VCLRVCACHRRWCNACVRSVCSVRDVHNHRCALRVRVSIVHRNIQTDTEQRSCGCVRCSRGFEAVCVCLLLATPPTCCCSLCVCMQVEVSVLCIHPALFRPCQCCRVATTRCFCCCCFCCCSALNCRSSTGVVLCVFRLCVEVRIVHCCVHAHAAGCGSCGCGCTVRMCVVYVGIRSEFVCVVLGTGRGAGIMH